MIIYTIFALNFNERENGEYTHSAEKTDKFISMSVFNREKLFKID